ncbi:hypothetical protein AB0C21_24205 [Spirillospora sp. NPDC049024]
MDELIGYDRCSAIPQDLKAQCGIAFHAGLEGVGRDREGGAA